MVNRSTSRITSELLILIYFVRSDHICKLMNKYIVETFAWNAVNTSQPTTVEQSYINAENFLQTQGAKTITKTVKNYAQRLSKEEIEFVKSLEVIRN